MKITLQQTLHGYQNGHQLLANSIPLPLDANRILLFQSDLSGSYTNQNFETYITGYPIKNSNLYAFSRTWYAHEMKRPGCVWTQTLLIKFPDLGKISELKFLLQFFKRPAAGDYTTYYFPIEFEFSDSLTATQYQEFDTANVKLIQPLYDFPDKSIVLPSSSARENELDILAIWSNQWPRLRRNFYFCSGALNLKTLDGKLFDLQIIPIENEKSIIRTHDNVYLANKISNEASWLKILHNTPKNTLRKFLWTYGSDIDGSRENFIPLLKVFESIYGSKNLYSVHSVITQYFPSPEVAKNLKTNLYGKNSILPGIADKQIVEFLIGSNDLSFLSNIELELEDRIFDLFNNGSINVQDLIKLWTTSANGVLSNSLWENFNFNNSDVIQAISTDHRLIDFFANKYPGIFYEQEAWNLPFDLQKRVLLSIRDNIDLNRLTTAILESSSDIIFNLYEWKGSKIVTLSLEWINKVDSNVLNNSWELYIFKNLENVCINWLFANQSHLSTKILRSMFNYLPNRKLQGINFSHETWLNIYKKLKLNEEQNNLPYIATTILTIGFNNQIPNAEWLVSVTFQDVYDFASNRQIDYNLWNMIPNEYGDEFDDEDYGVITFFSSFINKPKKRHQIDSWDYCEYLIRTLCNKTIKYNWHPGAFLASFKSAKTFYRAIEYCASFKKGYNLILKINNHIDSKKINVHDYQNQFLKKFSKTKWHK